eukprot:GHRQ01039748.1.p1 GENE.GHRQ01039748.1~~GHRQ01039748.1.p1  ORF type:complete len:159 (-),score=53.10 GHRQ01039748.1:16-492(-)
MISHLKQLLLGLCTVAGTTTWHVFSGTQGMNKNVSSQQLSSKSPALLPVAVRKLHHSRTRSAKHSPLFLCPPTQNVAVCQTSAPAAVRAKFLQVRLLRRAADVAAGVSYLHSRNVCHGDLKCENVLLRSEPADPDGCSAKVADFGLSRALAFGQVGRY